MASTRLEIIANNLVDDYATLLSSTSFAPAYPLGNLKKTGREQYAATQSASDVSITINFAHSMTTSAIGLALIGDFSNNANFSAQAWSGANGTGTLRYDSGVTAIQSGYATASSYTSLAQPYWLCFFETGTSAFSSVVLQISDASNPLGHHRLCRLLIGETFVPSYAYRFGDSGLTYLDESSFEEDRRGNPHFIPRPKNRVFRFSCNDYTISDVLQWLSIYRYTGKRRDLFAQFRSDQSGQDYLEHGMLCRIAGDFSHAPISPYRYRAEFELQEAMGERM